jgi:hypothetical protein
MNEQIKNQFDRATLIKIGRGALIAGTATVALYLLDWVGTLDLDIFTPLVAAIVPIIVNAIKEYKNGS